MTAAIQNPNEQLDTIAEFVRDRAAALDRGETDIRTDSHASASSACSRTGSAESVSTTWSRSSTASPQNPSPSGSRCGLSA